MIASLIERFSCSIVPFIQRTQHRLEPTRLLWIRHRFSSKLRTRLVFLLPLHVTSAHVDHVHTQASPRPNFDPNLSFSLRLFSMTLTLSLDWDRIEVQRTIFPCTHPRHHPPSAMLNPFWPLRHRHRHPHHQRHHSISNKESVWLFTTVYRRWIFLRLSMRHQSRRCPNRIPSTTMRVVLNWIKYPIWPRKCSIQKKKMMSMSALASAAILSLHHQQLLQLLNNWCRCTGDLFISNEIFIQSVK